MQMSGLSTLHPQNVCLWFQITNWISASWHCKKTGNGLAEFFFRITGLCAGNPPVNSPHKGQWHRALMFSLNSAWTKGSVNNWDASDLRCHHHAHYDITVMLNQWETNLNIENHQQICNVAWNQFNCAGSLPRLLVCPTSSLGCLVMSFLSC